MRRLTGSLLAAGLLAGGGMTGAALGLGGPAGADDVPAGASPEVRIEEPGRLREVLDGLVEQGTITSAQADAVAQALRDAAPRLRHFAHQLDVAGRSPGGVPGIGADVAGR